MRVLIFTVGTLLVLYLRYSKSPTDLQKLTFPGHFGLLMSVDQKVNKGVTPLIGELILTTIMCKIFSYTMEARTRQKSETQDLRGHP